MFAVTQNPIESPSLSPILSEKPKCKVSALIAALMEEKESILSDPDWQKRSSKIHEWNIKAENLNQMHQLSDLDRAINQIPINYFFTEALKARQPTPNECRFPLSSRLVAYEVVEAILKEYKTLSYFKLALQNSIRGAESSIQSNHFGIIYPDLYEWTYDMAKPLLANQPQVIQKQSDIDRSFIEKAQNIHHWIWLCPAAYSNLQLDQLLSKLFTTFKKKGLIQGDFHLYLVIPFVAQSTKQVLNDLPNELHDDELISDELKKKVMVSLISGQSFRTVEETVNTLKASQNEISEDLQKMASKEIEEIAFRYFADQLNLNPFA